MVKRASVEQLLRRIERGDRLGERDKRGLGFGERLRVQRAERAALRAMSPNERMLTYHRGGLSGYQLSAWWSEYPDEIPRIDDVPEWLAATLVDICEHPDYERRCRQLRVGRLTGEPR